MEDIGTTFGALFVGGFVAAVFSGIVTAQAFSYFKYYVNDNRSLKALVGWLRLASPFLDICHTLWVAMALWDHLIAHFGDVNRIDYIPWSLAITIAFTAILTFLVHLHVHSSLSMEFFLIQPVQIFRIPHLQTLNNYIIAAPIGLLATARLCFACLTTGKMYVDENFLPYLRSLPTLLRLGRIKLRSLKEFVALYTVPLLAGFGSLALSSVVDILITVLLCYLLLRNHKKNSSMNGILDKLMLYAFENGSLTSAATVASLICWLTMLHKNLIFMGIHFVISKLYANSLLATLNARKTLVHPSHRSQQSNSSERNHAIMFPDTFSLSGRTPTPLRVKVDQTKTITDDSSAYVAPIVGKTSHEAY
ncbi:hypothetical protein CVT26_007894 [Gymnopilus dilepis]|uniref:DUF6534 domain-containing protein n=1 Tax=Gymnopilus dilepis TaxID=231916 RepID=A0A409YKE1_9AGAR|nr:hypothetical protein CVT26_007894 [Gymnopilus dilepis]